MEEIKLRKAAWKYDPDAPIGSPGGFGQVFVGRDQHNQEVAVKRLHISSNTAGNRELTIAEELSGKPYENVIPFFDSGIDAESKAAEEAFDIEKVKKKVLYKINEQLRRMYLNKPFTASILLTNAQEEIKKAIESSALRCV